MQLKNKVKELIKWVINFFSQTSDNNIPVYAANATLFIIISIFPAAMVLFAILQNTPLTVDDLTGALSGLVPSTLLPFVEAIVNDIFTRSSTTLLSVAAVTAVWSASRGVSSVLIGMNNVYDVDDTRNFVMRKVIALFYMVGVLIAIVLTLVLHVFGTKLGDFIIQTFPQLTAITTVVVSFKTLIVIVSLTAIFSLIYKVFPNRPAKYFSQLPGAVLASLGWLLFSNVFGYYVDNYANYSYVYGSLATIVIAMLWLYFCMMIMFMGGALNSYLEKTGIVDKADSK